MKINLGGARELNFLTIHFSEKFPVSAVYDCTDIYSVLKVLAKISQENFNFLTNFFLAYAFYSPTDYVGFTAF